MKQTSVCPKCNSKKIGYLENVIQRTVAEFESHALRGHCPAPLGISRSESGGFLKVIKEEPVGSWKHIYVALVAFMKLTLRSRRASNMNQLWDLNGFPLPNN